MISWTVIVAVGLGSAVLRIVPLVARADTTLPPRVERGVHHGGTAAVTALVVTSTVSAAQGSTPLLGVVLAVLVGLVLAVRGRSMLFVVGAGTAAAVAATLSGVLLDALGGVP